MAYAQLWSNRLADERSKKVVFLSHCLLNENTRYPGGACQQDCANAVLQSCVERGFGIVQMPCPEEIAWGGVLKKRLLFFFGSEGTFRYRFRNVLLPVILWYTKRKYQRIARYVSDQIADYLSSGFVVAGIVAVEGSPTCGLEVTLDMKRALESVGRLPDNARAKDMNEIVNACRLAGTGLFIGLLRKELARQKLDVPFLAHDFDAEPDSEAIALPF